MKQNRLKQFLCLLFLLLCLTPLAVFLLAGPSSAGANERLAAKPRLYTGTSVNWDVLSDAADYFAGSFGLRQELITADAAVQAAVFHESATDDVLLGTDGWLYYADTLGDFTGSSAMEERQLWCAARNLALMQEYAASRGAQLLFVCAPNKNTIYPEFMPARYLRSTMESDLDRLLAALREEGVPFCDVRGALRDAGSLTYYRTDSHWNGYGSALAHDQILAALGRGEALADETFTMQPHRGDLFEMLYPASSRAEYGPALARARSFSYAGDFHAADDQRIRTTSGGFGTLLMFRDSFGNALHADLAEDFGEALFSRAMPYDLSLMDEAQPDTLIVELVERNLSWLCTRPPLLPAPVRERTFDNAADRGTLAMVNTNAPCDGLLCYTGTFSTLVPDADAPVYVLADGVCYEACQTEDGFQLLIPPCESLTVYTASGGQEVCFQAVLSDGNS